ncbi:MAG: alpha/beta hydrolase [Acidimicrobiales bacterium]|nr:alpha/beta hydrolase [Acidimicrobiales bacterium]
MVTQRVVDVGAVRLVIDEAGRGGDPLLLVHGFTGARSDFDWCLEPLADLGWHVVAPDLRGHGESDKPDREDAYTFETFTADLTALVDALGWDRFVLLGHSMGGMVAQVLVVAAPERLRALVLMDTHTGAVALDPALVDLGVQVAREGGTAAIADVVREMGGGALETAAYRRLLERDPSFEARGDANLRASSGAMYAAMARLITSAPDRSGALAAVRCPTLVIVGADDEPFLEASVRMAATIPGARLVVIDGAGHLPQFEAPDAWWSALVGFLTDVGRVDDESVEVSHG